MIPSRFLNSWITRLLLSFSFFALLPSQVHSADHAYTPTVLVTGANRGMGLEYARQYADKGYRVIATARKPARAEELNAIAESNPLFIVEQLDVTDHAAMEALGDKYADQPIDILLSNAGVGGGPFEKQSLGTIDYEAFDFAMSVNTYGPLKLAEVFLPHVTASQEKKIIAISSNQASIENAIAPGPGPYIYRVSKTALNMAYRTMSKDVAKDGVIVGLVTPPRTNTDMQPEFVDRTKLNDPKNSAADIIKTIEGMTLETSGSFYGYQNKEVPW